MSETIRDDSKILLSIIVLSYNTLTILRDCLASVVRNPTTLGPMEVIVVDNASTDGSPEMVRKEFPDIRLMEKKENTGFASGNNVALRCAKGDYLLLLNSDTLVFPDTFDRLLKSAQGEKVGVVGPQLIGPDGSIQPSARELPGYAALLFNRRSLMTRLFPQHPWARRYLRTDLPQDRESDIGTVGFAAALIPRPVLEKVGLLDEQFFMYAEDVDYCLRVHQMGYRVIYNPVAKVIHLDGGSSRHQPVRTIVIHSRSVYQYWRKHYRPNLLLRLLAVAMLTIRGMFQAVVSQLQLLVGFVRVHF